MELSMVQHAECILLQTLAFALHAAVKSPDTGSQALLRNLHPLVMFNAVVSTVSCAIMPLQQSTHQGRTHWRATEEPALRCAHGQ